MSNRHKLLKGSPVLLLAVAFGCAAPGGVTPDATKGIGPTAGAGLISNNAGGLISNNAGGLISNNAGGLISNNAGGLISNNAGGLISNNAGGLISNNAGGLSGVVKGPAAGLISNNAGGLISNNAGGLISNNAGGLISNNAGGLISNNAGGYNILGVEGNTRPVAGARVAVFNERGEQVSYAWSTTNDKGEYTFKRLKPSGPLLFVKAVFEVEGQQITLMSVAPAPREPGIQTIDCDPATTFVAKKMKEMTVKRAVSVVSVKPAAVAKMVEALAPVMSDRAIVAAVIFPEEKAAATFDNMLGEGDLGDQLVSVLGRTLASAGAPATLISVTPTVALPPSPDRTPELFTPGSGTTLPTPIDPTAGGSTGGTSGGGLGTVPTETSGGSTGGSTGGTPTAEPTAAPITSASTALGEAGATLSYGALAANGNALGVAGGSFLGTASVGSVAAGSLSLSKDSAVKAKAVTYGDDGQLYALVGETIVGAGKTVTISHSRAIAGSDLAVKSGKAYIVSKANDAAYEVELATGATKVIAGVEGSTGTLDAGKLNDPTGIVHSNGALYIADSSNHQIRKIDLANNYAGSIFAGGAGFGTADGNGGEARFQTPSDVTADAAGNLYVADQYNGLIRKIDAAGEVTTISAGLNAFPYSIAFGTVGGASVLFYDNGGSIKVLKGW